MQDFESVLQKRFETNHLFVDKTEFIKKFIIYGQSALLFVRPRRFGKSFNLSMLHSFFAAEYEAKDNRIVPKKGSNSKEIIFKGGVYEKQVNGKTQTIKYERLKIADDEINFQYQGKHPVIHITLKDVCKDLKTFENDLKKSIAKTYSNYIYLIVSEVINSLRAFPTVFQQQIKLVQDAFKLDISTKTLINKLYQKFWTNEKIRKIIQQDKTLRVFYYTQKKEEHLKHPIEIQQSLIFLANLMKNFYNQKVVVLIDQYDAGILGKVTQYINNLSRYTQEEQMETRNLIFEAGKLITQILTPVSKDSASVVYKIAMFGVSEVIVKEGSSGSGLNSISVIAIGLVQSFESSFGFTKDEVSNLVNQIVKKKKMKSVMKSRIMQQLQLNFNGFGRNKNIFNPWSTMRQLNFILQSQAEKNCLPSVRQNWSQSSINQLLKSMSIKKQTYQKLSQMTIQRPLFQLDYQTRQSLSKQNVERFMDGVLGMKFNNNQPKKRIISDNILFFLLSRCGYLMPIMNQEGRIHGLRLPSKEIESQFHQEALTSWIRLQIGMRAQPLEIVRTLSQHFYEQKPFLEALRKDFLNLYQGDQSQADFAGGLYGIMKLGLVTEDFVCKSRMQLGVNRKKVDTAFLPKSQLQDDNLKTIVIHQYKVDKSKNMQGKIINRCDEALWQCLINDYLLACSTVQNLRWKNVILRGIVFWLDIDLKWHVDLKQYSIPQSKISNIRKYFSTSNLKKAMDIKKNTKGKDNNIRTQFLEKGEDARFKLLQSFGFNSLDELVNNQLNKIQQTARSETFINTKSLDNSWYSIYDGQEEVINKVYPAEETEERMYKIQLLEGNEQIQQQQKHPSDHHQNEGIPFFIRDTLTDPLPSQSILFSPQKLELPIIPETLAMGTTISFSNRSSDFKSSSNNKQVASIPYYVSRTQQIRKSSRKQEHENIFGPIRASMMQQQKNENQQDQQLPQNQQYSQNQKEQ